MQIVTCSTLLSVLATLTYAQQVSRAFSDTQQFFDLSTYNFHLGRNFIYEYSLTARQGKQVSLYLFQNNYKQYSINVYDGTDKNAPQISTQGKIPKNDKSVEYPAPVTSTSGSLYIVLTADNTDPQGRVDFQALVTDYAQPAACGNLLVNINKSNNATIFELLANCQYVFHANDPGNNLYLTQNVQDGMTLNSDKYTLYKGLIMDNTHKLVNNREMTYIQATDKYLLFNTNENVAFTHYWYLSAGNQETIPVGIYTHGSLMTVDYVQDEYPDFFQGFEQDFTIQRYPPVTSIQITYWNLLGTGSLTVTPYMNNKPTAQPVTYTPANFHGPFNVTYNNCDQIQLRYTTPDRKPNVYSGFYGLLTDVSDYQVLPSTAITPKCATAHALADPAVHIFSDTQQFIDISTYNFYLGRNTIYESLFTARPGRQVDSYLFQNNDKQYKFRVFDGDNDQAKEITTEGKIPKNDELVEYR